MYAYYASFLCRSTKVYELRTCSIWKIKAPSIRFDVGRERLKQVSSRGLDTRVSSERDTLWCEASSEV